MTFKNPQESGNSLEPWAIYRAKNPKKFRIKETEIPGNQWVAT